MIHTNRTVTVGEQESIINIPIVLYRGDREVEIEFTLIGNRFTFSEKGNVIKSVNASHGQLVLNTPSGEHMFSELAECHEGKVVFVVTKEMIDEFIEIGFYSFQIRLYDSAEMKSRVTIPPVMNGFDIRDPIAAEDETNVVDQATVDYARIVKDQSNEELPTFTWDGEYNKTEWVHHDVITENKMNKIEDALYSINANIKESDVVMLNTLDQVKKDADAYVKEHMAEVEADVEEFERNLNAGVEKFKVDTNATMTAHKNEVGEELESVSSQLAHIEKLNLKNTFTVNIPNDFETLQEAIDYYSIHNKKQGVRILLNIKSGHKITKGLKLRNGDYSNFEIISEDDVVYLSDDFSPVSYDDGDGLPIAEADNCLILGINCNMVTLGCLFDMNNKYGTGYYGWNSKGVVKANCGVINAGYRGCEARTSHFDLKQSNFSGSNNEGIRMQHGSTCTAMGMTVNDCCKKSGNAAIYVSKGSLGNFREGQALRSGSNGILVRRSRVDCEQTDFSYAKECALRAESNASISAIGCICNNSKYGVHIQQSSTVAGVREAKGNTSKDLYVYHGAILIASGTRTTNSPEDIDIPDIGDTNLTAFNVTFGNGIIFVRDADSPVELITNDDGTCIKFYNGFMITISKNYTHTETIEPDKYSSLLPKPNIPYQLTTILYGAINAWGRDSGKGGDRIGVDVYGRMTTGDRTFRIKNTGASTTLSKSNISITSIQYSEVLFGLWK